MPMVGAQLLTNDKSLLWGKLSVAVPIYPGVLLALAKSPCINKCAGLSGLTLRAPALGFPWREQEQDFPSFLELTAPVPPKMRQMTVSQLFAATTSH